MPISQLNPAYGGYSNFGQGTPKTVSVTAGSTMLLAANSNRLYAQINNNGPGPIWVQVGIDAEVGHGTKLMPKGQLEFTGNQLYTGIINAVSESVTVPTDVIEGI